MDPHAVLHSGMMNMKGLHMQEQTSWSGQRVLSALGFQGLSAAFAVQHAQVSLWSSQESCSTQGRILKLTQKDPLVVQAGLNSSSVPEASARCLAFLNAVRSTDSLSSLKKFKPQQGLPRRIAEMSSQLDASVFPELRSESLSGPPIFKLWYQTMPEEQCTASAIHCEWHPSGQHSHAQSWPSRAAQRQAGSKPSLPERHRLLKGKSAGSFLRPEALCLNAVWSFENCLKF